VILDYICIYSQLVFNLQKEEEIERGFGTDSAQEVEFRNE
jgi:hypothetical protein